MAFGFASFATGRNSELSLVDGWQESWERRRQRSRSRSPGKSSEAGYLRQLSREEEG